ncbi:TPA: hypothetical protein WIX97_000470 [Neisseria meningitidis]|uniref:Uncharacterized protein n=1 Tax=Neisseria polysaccharea TaxID=489 RepID=A0ABV1JIG4_NEIPO
MGTDGSLAWAGFCFRKQRIQGEKRSKVEHLASIFNAEDAALWGKNHHCQIVISPHTVIVSKVV